MAKDFYHAHVKESLTQEGWEITHDPFTITIKSTDYPIDLGAERLLAAEKGTEKIAIEIKSFLRDSVTNEFHTALGQFLNYRLGLQKLNIQRRLFLVVPHSAYEKMQELPLILMALETYQIDFFVYHTEQNTIELWKINSSNTKK
ncbi:MAG: element excision factor XisH family protein [Bacteroidota bacterium]